MKKCIKKGVKSLASLPKRQHRVTFLLSEEEQHIMDCYLKKYKITNKSHWLRQTILRSICKKMEEDYPTLFGEHDMRR